MGQNNRLNNGIKFNTLIVDYGFLVNEYSRFVYQDNKWKLCDFLSIFLWTF